MTRLYVLVEGQTEEAFVARVLAPHLVEHRVWSQPVVVATSRELSGRKHRGGGGWKRWERDLRRLTAQRAGDARFTSLFDLYGLPEDFPGLAQHGTIVDTKQRVERLELAMAEAVGDQRFIPYLQRHEFEALVLAALEKLGTLFDKRTDQEGVEALRRSLGELKPEDINDGPSTAPSKRLLQHVPGYVKTVHGPTAAQQEGLPSLRARCPRLDAWVSKLEALGAPQP
ncbi:DUF4276 family protein [Sorangium sp. So ce1128]